MAYYLPPTGGIILYPEIADWAFVNISPLTFVNKLMAANSGMPVGLLTSENIKYTFVRKALLVETMSLTKATLTMTSLLDGHDGL